MKLDPLAERLALHAANDGNPRTDWIVTAHPGFARLVASTPEEYTTAREAFDAAEVLLARLLHQDYALKYALRVTADHEPNWEDDSILSWRGVLDVGVVPLESQ